MSCVYYNKNENASADHNMTTFGDYPLQGTRAQVMLDEAMRRAQAAGRSQRAVAQELGYKSSVVLSHMASGRVPIPVDRAPEMAAKLGMDTAAFVLAVLEQRYPDFDFRSLFNISYSSDRTVAKLEAIAGCSLDDLPAETRSMLEEVVAARHPRRRWLSPAEVSTMELVRDLRPDGSVGGLPDEDREAIARALGR
jgi:hypothetical protein